MRVFCADSRQNGVLFDHTYEAYDETAALKIARQQGWRFLGELVSSEDCPPDIQAMLERRDKVLH